jgi:hypothetical protein
VNTPGNLFFLIFLARKIDESRFILPQNSRENNADITLIRNVFLILILLFLPRKIAKTHFILA